MADIAPYIAAVFAGLSLLLVVAEKLFGGGNALAAKFHALETNTTREVSELRAEIADRREKDNNSLNLKIDEYEKVSTLGFDAIKSNITAMQMGLLEFRAQMSEGLHSYIRKDDYNAGVSEVKRDVQAGFRSVDERLGQLQDLIMYANPDAPPRIFPPKRG